MWISKKNIRYCLTGMICGLLLSACGIVPGARDITIPDLEEPRGRFNSINRTHEAVLYAPLGEDVLRPKTIKGEVLPQEIVGPYEMRNETIASALQFVLSEFDIPLALETELAMERTITIAGLKGPLDKIVRKMCSLADLYCSYEDGILVVKESETFTVSLPPLGEDSYDDFVSGLEAVTGTSAVVDNTTRSLIYSSGQRTHEKALRYFDRLRANTALIVFETHVWEVLLTNQNQTGIDWDSFSFVSGNWAADLIRSGSPNIEGSLGIGTKFTSSDLTFDGVFEFLATQGAVKTVSQPQITVLSGSTAAMRVGNSRDYISEVSRSEGFDSADDLSVTTSTIETGLSLEIESAWDDSTVYGKLKIELQELVDLVEKEVSGTNIQLPETSERSLETRIRVRPGDALLIGGIVTERDDVASSGLGFMKPFLPTSRNAQARNTELVIMMRPRVIIFTNDIPEETEKVDDFSNDRYTYYTEKGAVDEVQERKVRHIKEGNPDIYRPSVEIDMSALDGMGADAYNEEEVYEIQATADPVFEEILEEPVPSQNIVAETEPESTVPEISDDTLSEYMVQKKPVKEIKQDVAPPTEEVSGNKSIQQKAEDVSQETNINDDIQSDDGSMLEEQVETQAVDTTDDNIIWNEEPVPEATTEPIELHHKSDMTIEEMPIQDDVMTPYESTKSPEKPSMSRYLDELLPDDIAPDGKTGSTFASPIN